MSISPRRNGPDHPFVPLEVLQGGERGLVVLAVQGLQERKDVLRPVVVVEQAEEGGPVAEPDQRLGDRFHRRLLEQDPKVVDGHGAGEQPRRDVPGRHEERLRIGQRATLGLRRQDEPDVLDVPAAQVRADDRLARERGGLERDLVATDRGAVDGDLQERGALVGGSAGVDLGAVRARLEGLDDLVDVRGGHEGGVRLLRQELREMDQEPAQGARVRRARQGPPRGGANGRRPRGAATARRTTG